MGELQYALDKAKNNSPGIDEVTAVLLRNLPDNMIVDLLYIINESFYTGYVGTYFMENRNCNTYSEARQI